MKIRAVSGALLGTALGLSSGAYAQKVDEAGTITQSVHYQYHGQEAAEVFPFVLDLIKKDAKSGSEETRASSKEMLRHLQQGSKYISIDVVSPVSDPQMVTAYDLPPNLPTNPSYGSSATITNACYTDNSTGLLMTNKATYTYTPERGWVRTDYEEHRITSCSPA